MTETINAQYPLMRSVSIQALLAHRDNALQLWSQAMAALTRAQQAAAGSGGALPSVTIQIGSHEHRFHWSKPHELETQVRGYFDAQAWAFLMKESGMRSVMDETARRDWDKQIHERAAPELTEANIRATFEALHNARNDLFERGVIAVFRRLSWDYKTNTPVKFGKDIIVRGVISGYRYGGDELDDLDRVMHLLDGKPEPDHTCSVSAALSARSWRDPRAQFDRAYLSIKTFKNRNGHVTFRRPDLVEQMNLILAKHHPNALPAPQ